MKTNELGDRMIKQLLNLVITKYHDLSVSQINIIWLSLRLQQKINLLATDKSQYFAQPRPIIVKYSHDAEKDKKPPTDSPGKKNCLHEETLGMTETNKHIFDS